MAIQKSQQPEMVIDLVRQMEEIKHFPKGLSERDKNGIAYKLMTDTVAQIKSKIELYETLPDCTELQGGKAQLNSHYSLQTCSSQHALSLPMTLFI